jgi:hypothetical protein
VDATERSEERRDESGFAAPRLSAGFRRERESFRCAMKPFRKRNGIASREIAREIHSSPLGV